MTEYIATFYSHYGAVCFKKNCEKLGIGTKIMPVPRNLSSSCGTCVRFWMEKEFEEVSLELNEEIEQIVQVCGQDYRRIYLAEE